jgi:hypothetical protein
MFNRTFASGRESGPYSFKIVSIKLSFNELELSRGSGASDSPFSFSQNSFKDILSNFSTGTSPKMVTACVSHGKFDTYSKNTLKTSSGVSISLV